jgi:hypothetical protein
MQAPSIGLASFVDGLAVQVSFLNRNEVKRAKEELVQQYLERIFAFSRGSVSTAEQFSTFYQGLPTRHEKPTLITRGTHAKVSFNGMLPGGIVEFKSMQQ